MTAWESPNGRRSGAIPTMIAMVVFWATLVIVSGSTQLAWAQSISCGEFRGLVCEGVFTDEPHLVDDPARITDAIARVTAANGNPFAVVIVNDARGDDPAVFAADLANAWGVGDPVEENGILVLVAIDERRTEVVTQAGIALPGSSIANAGRSFFAAGDFEGGVLAIIGAVDQILADGAGDAQGGASPEPSRGPITAIALAVVALIGLIGVGAAVARRTARRAARRVQRDRRIDASVRALEPRGDELEMVRAFSVPVPAEAAVTTADGVRALFAIDARRGEQVTAEEVAGLAAVGAVTVIDVDALVAATRVSLELKAGGERAILESGLEGSIDAARNAPISDDAAFDVALAELDDVVRSLRPHRVAAARRRAADALVDHLVPTEGGQVMIDHLGSLIMRAAPVLDGERPLAEVSADVQTAHATAKQKVERMAIIRSRLTVSDTRDVAAVALADLSTNVDESVATYGTVIEALEEHGRSLRDDGISLPAVAALLVLNNSGSDVPAFVNAYGTLRRGVEPVIALEAAMAGLFTVEELDAARKSADALGLPIAVAVALGRRTDDGARTYRQLLDRVTETAGASDAQVIAGILAVSLEPSIALDRWLETRSALAALGLSGSYADVAAAFGASEARGPRAFALSYAAQRSALEDAGYDALTRYAPELAHTGTSNRTDTWTGRPLGTSVTDFDPFTFFFLHWAATGGIHGGAGWRTLYSSPSWNDGGSNWWGGGGGFGSSGGSSWSGSGGGSRWGEPSGSPFSGLPGGGSFGGFGGGGGFSGGGGGGW